MCSCACIAHMYWACMHVLCAMRVCLCMHEHTYIVCIVVGRLLWIFTIFVVFVFVAVVGLFIMIAIRWNRPFPNSSRHIDGKFQHYIFYTLYVYNTTMYTLNLLSSYVQLLVLLLLLLLQLPVAVGGANRPMFSISFSFIEYIGVCRRRCRPCCCSMFIR